MINVLPCVPTILSQLLGLLEKRHEHLWSPLGSSPHIHSKISVTQGPGRGRGRL